MFNRFKVILQRNKFILLFIILCSFALGAVIAQSYNQVNEQYDISFKSEKSLEELNNIITIDNLNQIKEIDLQNGKDRFVNINVNKLINNKDIKIIQENEDYHLLTKSRYYDSFFFSSNKTVSTRAKTFIKELLITFDDSVSFNYDNIYITRNSANIYLVGSITSLVLTISYLIYLIINNKILYEQILTADKEKEITIFSKNYWQNALTAFHNHLPYDSFQEFPA